MDIFEVRNQLKTKSIYDLKLKVTFYARVSSEKYEQLNSLDNQISYYVNMIRKNTNWEYVDGYIDEGISGISTKNRENFNQMISDGKQGKFDLIITKEISRFARNTLDSIKYTRELLSNGVAVFFQNDNINTLDEDSELRLTIMSSIAQDELRKLSSRIKFGHAQAIKNHVVEGNSLIWGYKKNKGKLVIDEKEAEIVRLIFKLYAENEYGAREISNILYEKGYLNRRGNRFGHTTITEIIQNPKYKGYYCGGKVKVVDMFTKKQNFLPEEEWTMFKDETGDIVPAIVSEELWERANAILKKRSALVKKYHGGGKCNRVNIFTGILHCTHCDKYYNKKEAKAKNGAYVTSWKCNGKLVNGKDSCPSFVIKEHEMIQIITEAFLGFLKQSDNAIEIYSNLYSSEESKCDFKKQINDLQKKIDIEKSKISKLLEYNVLGKISDDDFLNLSAEAKAETDNLYKQIEIIKKETESRDDLLKDINNLKATLNKISEQGANFVDREFIENNIERIDLTVIREKEMRVDIVLKVGDKLECVFDKDKGNSGQMVKKICPERCVEFIRMPFRFDLTTRCVYTFIANLIIY